MSDPHQIERDLRDYLEKEPNLRREDRLKYLRAIFEKHLTFNRFDHMITRHDLLGIISSAKTEYSNFNLPMHISNKKIDTSELTSVAMTEALISYLNKNHLLKKSVGLEYTDNSYEYGEID